MYQCVWNEDTTENYIILREYIKCVLLSLTKVVGPTINLISRIYYFCERRKYVFNILSEYDIIIRILHTIGNINLIGSLSFNKPTHLKRESDISIKTFKGRTKFASKLIRIKMVGTCYTRYSLNYLHTTS